MPIPSRTFTAPPSAPTLLVRACFFVFLCAQFLQMSCTSACQPAGNDGGVLDAGGGSDGGNTGSAGPLDVPLGSGEVRCGLVERESELIGGPGAYGRVGHAWRCYNNKIRFIVQDQVDPTGNSAEGGTLIDVDLIRPDENSAGEDLFRELGSAVGINEVHVDRIEVVENGRNGIGIIRVSGTPTSVTLAPQAALLRRPFVGRIETEYKLHPDSSFIEITTNVFNDGDERLEAMLFADFVVLGKSGSVWTPEFGFGEIPFFGKASYMTTSRGGPVSYGYHCADGQLLIAFESSGVFAPVCNDNASIGRTGTYTRYLSVGDGSLSSVVETIQKIKNQQSGVDAAGAIIEQLPVRGTVTDVTGNPVAGARVAFLQDPAASTSGGNLQNADPAQLVLRSEAVTDAVGKFSAALPAGEYGIIAHAATRRRGEMQIVQIGSGPRNLDNIAVSMGGGATLAVNTQFLDETGTEIPTLPAKLTLEALDAPPSIPALGERTFGGATLYAAAVDGKFRLDIPAGRWRVHVTRGFTFSRFTQDVTIPESPNQNENNQPESVAVAASIRRAIRLDGIVQAEFHQHSLGSVDAEVPIPVKVMENAAEGIDFAASTEHDNVIDFAPIVSSLGLTPYLEVTTGNEVSYQGVGHFNVYPWQIDPAAPYKDVGARLWWQQTAPSLFSDVKQRAGDAIVQINHPRSSNAGYFASLGLDPVDATLIPQRPPQFDSLPPTVYSDWSNNFEAVEVNDSFGNVGVYTEAGAASLRETAKNAPSEVPSLADYLALLGAGMPVAAMGNSDTHGRNTGVGYPRNFVFLKNLDDTNNNPNNNPNNSNTTDKVKAAIRRQHVAVGQGCFLEFVVQQDNQRNQNGSIEKNPMGLADVINASALATDTQTRLFLKIHAPPHVDVGTLEIFANGKLLPLFFVGDSESHTSGPHINAFAPAGSVGNGAGNGAGNNAPANAQLQIAVPTSLLDAAQFGKHITMPIHLDESVLGNRKDLILVALSRNGRGLSPTGGNDVFCYTAPLYVDVDGAPFVPHLRDVQQVLR